MKKIEQSVQYIADHVWLGVVSLAHAVQQGELQDRAKRGAQDVVSLGRNIVDFVGTRVMNIDGPDHTDHSDHPDV